MLSALVGTIFSLALDLAAAPPADTRRLTRDELLDRIRGGWAGQMIGNIQGLPFEFKYKDEPGPLPDFTPNLARCRSDDDTDIEWVHLHAMDRRDAILIPYPELAGEWVRSINRGVWVANERARQLMSQGVVPPWTSHPALNPHSTYNLSGQFCAELYGLIAPGLPDAAGRIGSHYLHVSVRGEPIQATAYWTSMISLAFFERSSPERRGPTVREGVIERLATMSLDSVDPKSQHAEMVRDVLAWRRESPADWRAVRAKIQKKYRDERGWNMNATVTNGALVLTALLYGDGDFVETMRLSFALGYDADCNAATCGTILGVLHGAKALAAHPGWVLPEHYDNNTRDGLPKTQSLDDLVEMTARAAERVILAEGGSRSEENGRIVYVIPFRQPVVIEASGPDSKETSATIHALLDAQARKNLNAPDGALRIFAALRLAATQASLSEAERNRVRAVLLDASRNHPALAAEAGKVLKEWAMKGQQPRN
jgi:hypothetical protein